jgi:hypothetical protein
VTRSAKRAVAFLVVAAAVLGCLAYLRVLTTGELHDKYVYSDMGALLSKKTPVAQFVPFKSPSGYLFYAIPARTRGNAVRGGWDEFVQLIALDTLCSGQQACVWDPDKQIDVSCSRLDVVLRDRRILDEAKAYLQSKCTQDR